ncbi:MAG: TetR family transcriptional regulator [Rhizobiales bacterium]|nr:TetR family transcriptional regulator [Hyphomicrobiales bacterium]
MSVSSLEKSRSQAGDKQELIISAALDLFRHYGYRRTAMEDIARAAGVAKGTLYLYFRSKEDLFAALVHSLASQIKTNIDEAKALDLPLDEKLVAIFDAKLGFIYRWVLSSPHAAELTASHNAQSSDAFDGVDVIFKDAVSELLKKGVQAGEIDLAAAGLNLEAATSLLCTAAYGAERSENDKVFQANLKGIIGLVLRGLRP